MINCHVSRPRLRLKLRGAYLNPLNAALDEFEINTPLREAAFLAQTAHESQNFSRLIENLNYSAKRLTQVWPKRFPTLEKAQLYANNPEKLANFTYGGRNGNGPEAAVTDGIIEGEASSRSRAAQTIRRAATHLRPTSSRTLTCWRNRTSRSGRPHGSGEVTG